MQSVATKERSVWCFVGTLNLAGCTISNTTCARRTYGNLLLSRCCLCYALLQIFSKFIRTYGVTNSLFRHIVCLQCCEIRRRCRFFYSFFVFLSSVVAFFFSLCAFLFIFFALAEKFYCERATFCTSKLNARWQRRELLSSALSAHRAFYLYTARFTWLHTSRDDGGGPSIWNRMRMRLHIFKSKICRITSHFCLEKKKQKERRIESMEREKVCRIRNTSSRVHALPALSDAFFHPSRPIETGSDGINELNITRIKWQNRKIAPSQTYRFASYLCAHKCFICAERVETAQYLWRKWRKPIFHGSVNFTRNGMWDGWVSEWAPSEVDWWREKSGRKTCFTKIKMAKKMLNSATTATV